MKKLSFDKQHNKCVQKSKDDNEMGQVQIMSVLYLSCSFLKAEKTIRNKNYSKWFRGLWSFLAQNVFFNQNSVRSYKNFLKFIFYINCIKYI